MKRLKYLVFVFLSLCERIWGANILYMSTTTSPSHNIWDKTLANALRDKGHQITFVTPTNMKKEENMTIIFLEDVFVKLISEIESDIEESINLSPTENTDFLFDWLYRSCELIYSSKGIQKVLKLANDGFKFDLIIFDITSGLCYYPIVELFNYPLLVGTSPFGIQPFLTSYFGIDLHIAYVPYFTIKYTEHMNFLQRFYNYYLHMYEIFKNYNHKKYCKTLLDNFYQRDTKHIFEVEKNFSLFLPNYDPVLETPRPLPPDVIPVGGLHTKRAKSLPQDLQNYLDNSKDGVIIFSLGTNIRSDKLKENKKRIILGAFAQLKQNVIWKFESDISDLPKNVIIRKFLPQNDILAHPNVKLLINHGGSLSSQEAMFHGVPLITIPFFADQHVISHRVISRKIGLSINYNNMTIDYFVRTIKEVIENPIYTENIKKLSQKFRDKPDNPLDRAVFWIEHVLKHGGTEHLRSPARYMPFYQLELLDIWFVVAVVIIVIFFIIKSFVKKNKLKLD